MSTHLPPYTLALFLFGCTVAEAVQPVDGGARDIRPAPAHVTKEFAAMWGFNRLQANLIQAQLEKFNAELARLNGERTDLVLQGRNQFQLDLDSGDDFDPKTLEIKRKR